MAYTQHGWHIDGTTLVDRPIGLLTQNCGGPMGNCTDCFNEANTFSEPKPEPEQAPDRSKKTYYTKATVERLYEILGNQEIEVEKIYRIIDEMQETGFATEVQRRS